MLVFEERATGVLREKPPRAKETEEPTKLQPYMLLTPGFEPEPHWSRGGRVLSPIDHPLLPLNYQVLLMVSRCVLYMFNQTISANPWIVRTPIFLLIRLLRWLDWIFWGGYLPSLSINYVAMSKDMGKRLPQLFYIKMKIFYDLGFIAIGVAIAT